MFTSSFITVINDEVTCEDEDSVDTDTSLIFSVLSLQNCASGDTVVVFIEGHIYTGRVSVSVLPLLHR